MGGRLRVDVVKGQRVRRFVDALARDLAAQNAGEDIILVIGTKGVHRHVKGSHAIAACSYHCCRNRQDLPARITPMSADSSDEDYVYDEVSGEWLPAAELRARASAADPDVVEVRDSVGNLLADGDQVTLIKDLDVKGAGQTLRRGTLIKSIRLTGDPQEIDCKFDGIKGLVLRAEFVKKR
jgi:protein PhnA